ncbi:hypothetical protein ACTXT7_003676 [Hymenolepis weldensis]
MIVQIILEKFPTIIFYQASVSVGVKVDHLTSLILSFPPSRVGGGRVTLLPLPTPLWTKLTHESIGSELQQRLSMLRRNANKILKNYRPEWAHTHRKWCRALNYKSYTTHPSSLVYISSQPIHRRDCIELKSQQ